MEKALMWLQIKYKTTFDSSKASVTELTILLEPLVRNHLHARAICLLFLRKLRLLLFSFVLILIYAILVFVLKEIMYYVLSVFAFLYEKISSPVTSNEAWIGLVGSVLGGIITMIGIIITLRFERRRDEQINVRQAQPIMILRNSRFHDEKKNIADYKGICVLSNRTNMDGDLQVPDLYIDNVGLNNALDIKVKFHIHLFDTILTKPLERLNNKDTERVGIQIFFCKETIQKLSNISHKKERGLDINETDIALRITMNRDEYEQITYVTVNNGSIVLEYKDIYQNIYRQEFDAKLYIVKMNDEYSGFFLYESISK